LRRDVNNANLELNTRRETLAAVKRQHGELKKNLANVVAALAEKEPELKQLEGELASLSGKVPHPPWLEAGVLLLSACVASRCLCAAGAMFSLDGSEDNKRSGAHVLLRRSQLKWLEGPYFLVKHHDPCHMGRGILGLAGRVYFQPSIQQCIIIVRPPHPQMM
jgi:hypothetical protein